MSILVDGASDPTKIVFDGYRISRVVYDGVEVWPCFPSISGTVTLSYGSNVKVYLNDLVLQTRYVDATGVYAAYKCTISVDMSWSRYSVVESSKSFWNGGFQPGLENWSASGLPSNLDFMEFDYGTVNLDLARSTYSGSTVVTPYSSANADFNLVGKKVQSFDALFSWVDWDSFKSTYGIDTTNYWIGIALAGFVGQRSNCNVKLRKVA